MADSKFKKGDRVRVRKGMNHDDMTEMKTGTIVEISPTPALGIKFDGMEEVHHWYVDAELERWAQKEEPDGKKPSGKGSDNMDM